MKYEDADGIDGPFNKAMDRAMREDRKTRRGRLSLSEALEKHFPCGGCDRYTGGNPPHLAICPVNYRRRAIVFARSLGLTEGTNGDR